MRHVRRVIKRALVAFMIFDQRAQRLYPIARIHVGNTVNGMDSRLVNIAANNTVALTGVGQLGQLLFVIRDIADSLFYAGFYLLRKGVYGKPRQLR